MMCGGLLGLPEEVVIEELHATEQTHFVSMCLL